MTEFYKKKNERNFMAVFSALAPDDFKQILLGYSIGDFIKAESITEGSRNSTYKIITSQGDFILSIFENHDERALLDQAFSALSILNKEIPEATAPLINRQGKGFSIYNQHFLALFPFVITEKIELTAKTAQKAGAMLAKIHLAATHTNTQAPENIYTLAKLLSLAEEIHQKKPSPESLYLLKNLALCNTLKSLPNGLCHLDYFADNLLFRKGEIAAVIDWSLMGQEDFLYDFCIGLCAWGYNNNGQKINQLYDAFYQGYTNIRPLTQTEVNMFKNEKRRAACRFLTTRLYDKYFPKGQNAPILPPEKFIAILKELEN